MPIYWLGRVCHERLWADLVGEPGYKMLVSRLSKKVRRKTRDQQRKEVAAVRRLPKSDRWSPRNDRGRTRCFLILRRAPASLELFEYHNRIRPAILGATIQSHVSPWMSLDRSRPSLVALRLIESYPTDACLDCPKALKMRLLRSTFPVTGLNMTKKRFCVSCPVTTQEKLNIASQQNSHRNSHRSVQKRPNFA
jgi:hypothetical protein